MLGRHPQETRRRSSELRVPERCWIGGPTRSKSTLSVAFSQLATSPPPPHSSSLAIVPMQVGDGTPVLKRTVVVSSPGIHLAHRDGQLVLLKEGAELGKVPMEDMGVLILDGPGLSFWRAWPLRARC